MKLETAEVRYANALITEASAPVAAWCSILYPPVAHMGKWKLAGQRPPGEPELRAYVNHGRWVVDCPFCGSAQLASESDRRFFCAGSDGCANHQAGHRFLPVRWPDQAAEIEEILLERPQAVNQNWQPGETLTRLLEENGANLK